jgi:LacI family transcriptional regulator
MGTYQACQELGIRVPEDISVVSFDDSDLASWLRPRLSSVALPHFEMGRKAVELLLSADREPTVHRVQMPLRARSSVGPPSLNGGLPARG